jgi:hypothetical protein
MWLCPTWLLEEYNDSLVVVRQLFSKRPVNESTCGTTLSLKKRQLMALADFENWAGQHG